jgi:intracellular sulfur oxidation DsrE/DsrF family protein
MKRSHWVLASIVFAAALAAPPLPAPAQQSAAQPAKHRVVFQVSDKDPAKWNLTLNNVRNVRDALGKDKVDAEVVAYGPGLAMLKMDSEVGGRVADLLAGGVKFVACENTMHNQKVTRADMLPNIGYVPAGVVELMEKQAAGYAYIRP